MEIRLIARRSVRDSSRSCVRRPVRDSTPGMAKPVVLKLKDCTSPYSKLLELKESISRRSNRVAQRNRVDAIRGSWGGELAQKGVGAKFQRC